MISSNTKIDSLKNKKNQSGKEALSDSQNEQEIKRRVDQFNHAAQLTVASDAPSLSLHAHEVKQHQMSGVVANQNSSSSRFLRNAFLATTFVAAGLCVIHTVPDAVQATIRLFDRATSYASPDAKVDLTTQIDLQNIESILTKDLSGLSEDEIRKQLSYVDVMYQGKAHQTLDASSRLLLTKWASDNAKLEDVGLGWKYLYGVIHAESSWISRSGMGKNGVKSHGLAQFENATARLYGLTDALDPLKAVSASANLIRDAATWTQKKLDPLGMTAARQAQALHEGVSVFYNTGWNTRKKWTPERSTHLPSATKAHIKNVHAGHIIANNVALELRAGNNLTTPDPHMEKQATQKAEQIMSYLKGLKPKATQSNAVNSVRLR